MSGRVLHTRSAPTSSAAGRLDGCGAAPSLRSPSPANLQSVRAAARSDQFAAQEQSGGRCASILHSLVSGRMSFVHPHHPLLCWPPPAGLRIPHAPHSPHCFVASV